MRVFPLFVLAILPALSNGAPGDLIAYEAIGTVTAGKAASEIGDHFRRVRSSPSARTGVHYYRVRYRSLDVRGTEVTLSGLVGLPFLKKTRGLAVYCHGTVADRQNVPSRWKVEGQFKTEWGWAALALAHGNYAVAMPDYLGLGDHQGVHPYAVKENVRSVEDIVTAARTLAAVKGSDLANRLHITGYSEGGGIAMWAARLLGAHAQPRMRPTSSAPLAGPYDLSGVMARFIARSSTNLVDIGTRTYFMSYFAYSALKNLDGPPLESLFVPSFASYVPVAFERGGTDFQVIERITKKMVQVGGVGGIGKVLQPSVRKDLVSRNARSPLIDLLARNDCYDWTPRHPIFLVHLKYDDTVPSENMTRAVRAMRSRGVSRDLLGNYSVTTRRLSHFMAVPNCLAWTRVFFDGGLSSVRAKAKR